MCGVWHRAPHDKGGDYCRLGQSGDEAALVHLESCSENNGFLSSAAHLTGFVLQRGGEVSDEFGAIIALFGCWLFSTIVLHAESLFGWFAKF